MPDLRLPTTSTPEQFLGLYLRDHLAGATTGVALAQRYRRSNQGTPFGRAAEQLDNEIDADRHSLVDIMGSLNVPESQVKVALGKAAELVGRLKMNGQLTGYSPLSRVFELEGLAGAIASKRSLWMALRNIAPAYPQLATDQLDHLIERANSQLDVVHTEHDRAARGTFTSDEPHSP